MNKLYFTAEFLRKSLFILSGLLCVTPFIQPPLALIMGFILAQIIRHPFEQHNHKATNLLLQLSVIGLGFGMNLSDTIRAGKEGLLFTILSIGTTLFAGIISSKLLSLNKKTGLLISAGTAICGGSAIAAISPCIKANDKEISVSLGTVFILNALALFIFPAIGHHFHLSQSQFGLWAAIAIHDTSSVVGAAQKYGNLALQIATTIKLERALWIIPVSFLVSLIFKNKGTKTKIPYFIFFFMVAMLIHTLIPQSRLFGDYVVGFSKKMLSLTLFLIGSGLSTKALSAVGIRPFILGVALWALISAGSLFIILKTII